MVIFLAILLISCFTHLTHLSPWEATDKNANATILVPNENQSFYWLFVLLFLLTSAHGWQRIWMLVLLSFESIDNCTFFATDITHFTHLSPWGATDLNANATILCTYEWFLILLILFMSTHGRQQWTQTQMPYHLYPLIISYFTYFSPWEAMDPNANAIILFGTSTALALNAPIIAGTSVCCSALQRAGLFPQEMLQCVAVCCGYFDLCRCLSAKDVAVCCSALQRVAVCCRYFDLCRSLSANEPFTSGWFAEINLKLTRTYTLQHTATHCNTLQHAETASWLANTHCHTLQHTAMHFNTQQRTATHCNALQHTASYCNTQKPQVHSRAHAATQWKMLERAATYCNTLQHTTTHCNAL